ASVTNAQNEPPSQCPRDGGFSMGGSVVCGSETAPLLPPREAVPIRCAMVSIATWNINSVRLRIDQVVRFLEREQPDVLCLQEIKCREEQFPHAPFEALGYTHRVIHGQKGYHGVATVSRIPLREIGRYDWQDNREARHVGAELLGAGQGLVQENVY